MTTPSVGRPDRCPGRRRRARTTTGSSGSPGPDTTPTVRSSGTQAGDAAEARASIAAWLGLWAAAGRHPAAGPTLVADLRAMPPEQQTWGDPCPVLHPRRRRIRPQPCGLPKRPRSHLVAVVGDPRHDDAGRRHRPVRRRATGVGRDAESRAGLMVLGRRTASEGRQPRGGTASIDAVSAADEASSAPIDGRDTGPWTGKAGRRNPAGASGDIRCLTIRAGVVGDQLIGPGGGGGCCARRCSRAEPRHGPAQPAMRWTRQLATPAPVMSPTSSTCVAATKPPSGDGRAEYHPPVDRAHHYWPARPAGYSGSVG